MNGNFAEVVDLPGRSAPDLSAWVARLKSQLLEDWRPGEWDGGSWLFTGDLDSDKTVAWPCIIDTCPVTHKARNRRCKTCEDHFRLSGLTEEKFSATYRPSRNRVYMRALPCTVERDGARCQRELHFRGLCRGHSVQWIKASRAADKRRPFDGTLEEWVRDVAMPLGAWPDCLVAGCPFEQVTLKTGLCRIHYAWWSKGKGGVKVADFDDWIEHATPYLASHQFSLVPLSDIARLEVLYALQQRDLPRG